MEEEIKVVDAEIVEPEGTPPAPETSEPEGTEIPIEETIPTSGDVAI
jgi:hypothetical protein